MHEWSPLNGRRAYLVGCDAKDDTRVFSGSTYHLAMQGVQDGLLTGMVNLYPSGMRGWRVLCSSWLVEVERRLPRTSRLQIHRRISRWRLAAQPACASKLDGHQ